MEQAAAMASSNDLGDDNPSFVGLPMRALGTTKESQPHPIYISLEDVPRDLTQQQSTRENSKTYALQQSSNATTENDELFSAEVD